MRTDVFSKETQQMAKGNLMWLFSDVEWIPRIPPNFHWQSKKCEVVIRLVHAGRG